MTAGAAWLRLQNLGAYTGSFDEGIRSEQLFLMAAGYRPFQEVFASQGPLLLDLLFPFYQLFGQSLEAIRLGVVLLSLVALVGGGWVARMLGGPIAAIATLAILGVSPAVLESSRLALAEMPSLAPSIWSLGAGLRYQQTGRRRWLAASAILLALGLLIKPMVIPAAVAVGLALVLRPVIRLSDLVTFTAIVVIVPSIVIGLLGPGQVFEDLGAYRGGAARALGRDAAENWRLVTAMLARERLGFLALAALGAVGAVVSLRKTLPLLIWPIAVLVLCLLYDDLSDKHIVYLIYPLGVLGGLGLGVAVHAAWRSPGLARPFALGLALLGLVSVGLYLANLERMWRADRFILYEAEAVAERRRDIGAELEMSEIIGRVTDPGEFVLTDNPNAAFRARRPVPPRLVDTSGTRVDAGSLTDARAMEAVQQYRPKVIITWSGRLGRLDGFTRWLQRDYRIVRTYSDNAWKLYLRQDVTL